MLDPKEDNFTASRHFLLDVVERNALMEKKSELSETLEMTERMQLVGFAMLYAGICPLATLIIVVYFMFDNALMRYSESNYQQRPLQTNMVSLGANWIFYLEVVTGIVTITNTFLLFFVSSTFKDFLKNNLGIRGNNHQLWLILGVEHALLGFLLFLKSYIADFPRKILKIKQRT